MKKYFFIIILFLTNTIFAQTKYHKGVWLANIGSGAMMHIDSIKQTVATCKAVGITDIYCVTWNRGFTLFKSKTMKKLFGYEMDTTFKNIDPLRILINEAHKEKIKVHAWFEFGFSSSYYKQGQHILNKFPNWAAKNIEGKTVVKNGFYWMNGFDPNVQKFIKDIIFDLLKDYKIDGIQGDDRLPALPSEAGYNKSILDKFLLENNTTKIPQKNDTAWTKYRVQLLNKFAKEIFIEVKKYKPKCIVSMSPSIYPWSVQEYLQDWPTWLKEGYVDYVIVQLYRYKIVDYERILKETLNHAGNKKNKVYAGILTSLADGYTVKEDFLQEMINLNKKYNLKGECYFYFEGINRNLDFYIKNK